MDEAMRQAVKSGDEELIPASVSDSDLTDEMNARSCKAGLTNRHGECVRGTGKIISMPASKRYRANYDKIQW